MHTAAFPYTAGISSVHDTAPGGGYGYGDWFSQGMAVAGD